MALFSAKLKVGNYVLTVVFFMPHIQTNTELYSHSRKKSKKSDADSLPALLLWAKKIINSIKRSIKSFVRKVFPNARVDLDAKTFHIQHTNYIYRIRYYLGRYAKIIGLLLLGILKCVFPVFEGMCCSAMITVAIIVLSNYSVAIDVVLDSNHIAYIGSEKEYDDIQAEVSTVLRDKEGEYILDQTPLLHLTVIRKDEMTDSSVLKEKLLSCYQEYIDQSYAMYIDGEMIGTMKNAEDFSTLLNNVASYYLHGDKTETYNILNNIEIVRDTYPRSYEKTYEDLFLLFTTSQNIGSYTVKKKDTADTVIEKTGMTLPLLRLLNTNVDFDNLVAGTVINTGDPVLQLKIQTIRYISYSEVIPYETKYTNTDSLYDGNIKIKQKGSNGINSVTAEIREVNGIETYREVVSKTKVKDAIARQILVGTKTIAPSGEFIRPVSGGYISSGFGKRTLRGENNYHRGLDIAVDYGTKIWAADAGTVKEIGYQANGLGNYIVIDHGNGILSYYGHCSKIDKNMTIGLKVYQGQVIAYVGKTGNSTGNHVHFALYNEETESFFDPLPYIS